MIEGIDRTVDLIGATIVRLDRARENRTSSRRFAAATPPALAATDGHFAAIARDGQTVRLARTIGMPLRYFVAKMYHGPFLVVADRIDRIFDWCQAQRIGWQFDPAYTRMVPAHYLVELDQVGCPDPSPRYHRFFDPPVAHGSPDIEEAGAAYVARCVRRRARVARRACRPDEPIAVAFSGGIDSTADAAAGAARVSRSSGAIPIRIRAFTLDFGGGADAAQAERPCGRLGSRARGSASTCRRASTTSRRRFAVIEDYHPLDVECAAAALCLLRGIRERYPSLRYLLDGDGGDENLKSYPLEDSDLTLSSVLRNPLLYQEGWGVDAIKHSLVYSGGLSRGYVRTYAPAAALGFTAFSPFTRALRHCRGGGDSVRAGAGRPIERLLYAEAGRGAAPASGPCSASTCRSTRSGASRTARRRRRARVSRRPGAGSVFNEMWQERLTEADALDRRSGTRPVTGNCR